LEVAFISENGSGEEFGLVGYDLHNIWQAAKAAQKRLSEWSTVYPQTAKRQAEVSALVGPLYELVHRFMIERNVDAKNTRFAAILGMLVSNGFTPRHQPTD
jgi:hypothetical protein